MNNNYSITKRIKAHTSNFIIPNKHKNFFNPSILEHNGNNYVFHREFSSKSNIEHIIKLFTKGVFVSSIYYVHKNKLTKIKIPNIENMSKYKNNVVKNIIAKGYEDARPIILKDKLVLVCCTKANSAHFYQMCLIKIDLENFINNSSSELKCTENDLVLLDPPMNEKRSQKNWSPFIYDNDLHLVCSINPQIIFSCNIDNGKIEKVVEKTYNNMPLHKMRGGSNLIDYTHPQLGNVFISIAHGKINRFYYHLFYICKKEYPFTILGYSDNFIFENNCIAFIDKLRSYYLHKVQFASTMCVCNDNLIIGYGEDDAQSKKCIIKITEINKIIKLL